jgi:two-component system LytT family response regulator
MIRVLIIDDDEAARAWIKKQLTGESDMEIVGECVDGEDALQKIELLRPNVVITEIEIPKLSGLELMCSPNVTKRPYVIVTTVSDKYAVRAFEASVIDYLLKPYDIWRFKAAILKLRSYLDRDSRLEGKVNIDTLVDRLRVSIKF